MLVDWLVDWLIDCLIYGLVVWFGLIWLDSVDWLIDLLVWVIELWFDCLADSLDLIDLIVLFCRLVYWLIGFVWFADLLSEWLDYWLVGCWVGLLIGWLIEWLVDWLHVCLVGRLLYWLIFMFLIDLLSVSLFDWFIDWLSRIDWPINVCNHWVEPSRLIAWLVWSLLELSDSLIDLLLFIDRSDWSSRLYDWLVDWLLYWLFYWLVCFLGVEGFIDCLFGFSWLIEWLVVFVDWSVDGLLGWIIDSLIHWLIDWFACLWFLQCIDLFVIALGWVWLNDWSFDW